MGKPLFAAPKGTRDLLPDEAGRFSRIEAAFRRACGLFGYEEIRTPHLENVDLFARAVGETTDIVEKEMYTLQTKGGDKLALRPENTAGVLRAYLEAGLHRTAPRQRLFYIGSMFRHESSQKKRWREFTQAGVECLGSPHPEADAEVVALALHVFAELGLEVRTELSTFGCPDCRGRFRAALAEHYSARKDGLCPDCARRLERNVFRLLDCKDERCRAMAAEAPTIERFLDAACREHFAAVQEQLRGQKLEFVLNMRLVRGLDYYNRTIFEFFLRTECGRQDALGAGGRYDGLGELLGGPRVHAVGFALGVDRIALALAGAEQRRRRVEVYIAAEPGEAGVQVPALARDLRKRGVSCATDVAQRQLGAQMEEADRLGAMFAVMLGVREVVPGQAVLRDLDSGVQRSHDLSQLVDEIVGRVEEKRRELRS